MTDQEFNKAMEHIISALSRRGYDPYDQLTGYITTGETRYITSSENAREIIKTLAMPKVKSYVLQMKK